MLRLLEAIGHHVLAAASTIREMGYLTGLCGVRGLMPASYNPAVRLEVTRQLYYTGVQTLPLFLIITLGFGTGAVGAAVAGMLRMGLADRAGGIVVNLLVLELAPLVTALLVGLRSGSAVDAELATMAQSGELRTLDLFGIDPATYLFLPRIIATMVTVSLLTGIFALLVLTSAYLFLFWYVEIGLNAYMNAVMSSLTGTVAALLLAKSLLLGFLVAFIPLYSGITGPPGLAGISIAVQRGMVRLFLAIMLVEILTLGLQ